MKIIGKMPNRILLLVLSIVFFGATFGTAQARSKAWYFGAGYLAGSATGELNGTQTFYPTNDTTNGPSVYGVKLDEGSGFVINAGYAVSKWIAFELLQIHINMDATSASLDAASTQYSGENLDADLDGFIFAVRPMLPLGPLEVFGRFGFGGYSLDVQRNAVITANPNLKDSTFSGGGYAFGGGVALSFGRVGIEASYTQHEVGFDSINAASETGSISRQDMTFKTAMVILTIHFGKDLK